MKEPMCNYVCKVPGSNNYQFRRKIPQDLIQHYNKKEIKQSLRTSDRREATRLSRIEAARLDAEWERIRGVGSANLPTLENSISFSVAASQVQFIRAQHLGDEIWKEEAKLVRERVKASVASLDLNKVEHRAYYYLSIAREQASLAMKHGLYEDYLEKVRSILSDREEMLRTGDSYFLGNEYYEAPEVSEAMRNGYQAFLKGTGPTVWFNAAPSGDSSNTVVTQAIPCKGEGASLFSLLDRWAAERQRNLKTVDAYNLTAKQFRDLVGKMSISDIKREDAVRFKDELLKVGKSPANIRKQLTVLNTLLNFAVANALIDSNPAKGVSIAIERREKPRISFDIEALNAIFLSPVYTEGYRPKAGAGEAAYWIPLLALFTGARLEELGQLHPSDVIEETYYDTEGKVATAWIIRIKHSEENGQSVKNPGSNRRIPIHTELIRLGFLDYALQAKKEKRYRIFDKLFADKAGTETAQFSKWFGRYLRGKCGVINTRMTFHSFRHTFKDFCRTVGIEAEIGDRLTGHANNGVGASYGADQFPLLPLVNAMKRYRTPGFNLLELKVAA
jgi:integrase